MGDFLFSPELLLLASGRAVANSLFFFSAVGPLYLFATNVYPDLRPPDNTTSNFPLTGQGSRPHIFRISDGRLRLLRGLHWRILQTVVRPRRLHWLADWALPFSSPLRLANFLGDQIDIKFIAKHHGGFCIYFCFPLETFKLWFRTQLGLMLPHHRVTKPYTE